MELQVVYYTDPLCCWSWAFEPQWRRLRYEFAGSIRWRYCMGGLIPDWKSYNDTLNSINRPLQMGPLWYEAKQISGMPMYDQLWMEDPPGSSFPSCIAVKCAALQSSDAEENYLRLLREAVMVKGKNIAKQEVLFEIAAELEMLHPQTFSRDQFEQDLLDGAGHEPFREDIKEIRFNNIVRFPTLTISKDGNGVAIVGFRPYEALLEAIKKVAPDIKPSHINLIKEDYLSYWRSATEREIAEIS